MITAAAGQVAALVWEAGAVLAAPMVTIVPTAGGDPLVGPTAAGLGVSGTTYTYVWQVPAAAPEGPYTAVLDGTDGATPVEVELAVFVTAEPVYASLDAIKDALKITDNDRDALIADRLSAASRQIDRATGRRFWLNTEPTARVINPRGKVFCDDDGAHLLVKDVGDVAGLLVEVGRTAAWTDVTGSVEPEPTDALDEQRPVTSLLRASWPVGIGQRVRVTARWGWPQVPAVVSQATALQATRLFKRKDSPEGITGSAEWGVIRLSRVDPDVHALIEHLIIPGIG
ncbi:head-tail connector protein [Streptomyces halstedii]|uniref:head-tail connector protein n=1 Tax=Streptomyces halstedii TaxID=1944 RepID=UPI003345BCDD